MQKPTSINRSGTKVRLKVSGQAIDPSLLSDNFIESVSSVFQNEVDPFAILSTFAYIFCGLKINDIKEMVILSDRSGTRTASREYIRQKIVATFKKIQLDYIDNQGSTGVSPISRERNIDPTEVTVIREDRYMGIIEEDDILDGEEDQAETTESQTEDEEEWVSTQENKDKFNPRKTSINGPEGRDDHVDRPGYSATWLVHLKDKLHKWWN